jgi:hypothetical protein
MTERDEAPEEREFSARIAQADFRDSLEAIRDTLAQMIDNPQRATHRRECICICGIGDDRTLVPILKELRAVVDAIEALPAAEGDSRLDRIAAGRADELAARRGRALRGANSAS